jgi:TatD DNase family protein
VNDHNPEEPVQSRAVDAERARDSDRDDGPARRGVVDTHCHLFLVEGDPAPVLEAARTAGVDKFVCPGIDPATSRRSLELAESFQGVFATAGMHPHDASAFDDRAGAEIEELLAEPRVVAVGECGLDFNRMRSPRGDQERAFLAQIGLARDAGIPLVVHSRDAWPDILRVLDEGSAERVVLHCFSGDTETARECVRRGYHLSFAGNLTYPRNEALRAAAAAIPLDSILVETDSPYLPPQRLRGRDNQPANVIDVIEELARVRGEPIEVVREATGANARAAFPGIGEGQTGPNGRSA